jgi:predicted TPR repeat methyltransferase
MVWGMTPSSAATTEDHEVGDLAAARAHRREGLVAGRVEERDHAARRLHVVRADVLGDAARLAHRHARLADRVEERGLAVVDVAHHGDHRRARHEAASGPRPQRR